MRRYQRIIVLLIIVVAVIALISPMLWIKTQLWFADLKDGNAVSEQATSSIVYPLDSDKWVSFAIQKGTQQLRIITNADINPDEHLVNELGDVYQLQYQLLDNDNQILHHGSYQQRSRLTQYQNPQGHRYYPNYYNERSKQPLDGRLFILNLAKMGDVAAIKIKLETHDPQVTGVAVRLYQPIKIEQRRLGSLWLRMSQSQKEKLAKGSIYPSALLSEAERANLLKNQWSPIGPIGTVGQDYIAKILYTLRDTGNEQVLTEFVLPAGLYADYERPAIIAIPETGGELKIGFKALDGNDFPADSHADVYWYGRTIEHRWQQSSVAITNHMPLTYHVEGGLLKMQPLTPVILTATLKLADGNEVDITPEPLKVKTYFADAKPDFDVLHAGESNTNTVVRLDVRRYFNEQLGFTTPKISYQCFNDQHESICQGTLQLPDMPSEYDRLKNVLVPERVSDPMSFYLTLGKAVSYLRVYANQANVLVNAYNQPSGLIKTSYIPEDSYISLDKEALWQPSWFPINPSNYRELSRQQKIMWIYGQYHPPIDKPDLLAGNYQWQDFIPINKYSARYILTDYQNNRIRDEALSSVYCHLPVGKPVLVDFKATAGQRSLSPDLLYIRHKKQAFNIQLTIDNEIMLSTELYGRQGQLRLPAIAAGKHKVLIDTTAGGKWLINNISHCNNEPHLKRRVFKLNPVFVFDYQHKAQDELISGRFYTTKGQTERGQIKVTIIPLFNVTATAATVTEKWTFTQRLYDLRPEKTGNVMALSASTTYLNDGQQFFIPINNDLPPGKYRVKVEAIAGPTGYIALSQVTPGAYESRQFYRELVLDEN